MLRGMEPVVTCARAGHTLIYVTRLKGWHHVAPVNGRERCAIGAAIPNGKQLARWTAWHEAQG